MYMSPIDLQAACTCTCLAFLISSTWSMPLIGQRFEPEQPEPRNHQLSFSKRNFNTVKSIYELTIFPNQLPILQEGGAAVPPGLFNENATGRVDPVGNFTGFEDSVEYFFALAPVPQTNAASTAITSIKITEFSSACANVAASVVYLYTSVVDATSPDNGKALAPLKQVAFWKFDESGAVAKYDAWIPNLNDWIAGGLGIDNTSPQVAAQSIQRLCGTTQQQCTGANTQWSSIEECITTLSRRPFGNFDEAWGDNVACRSIHVVLTQVRPDVHCPHVGPTGGSKCVNVPYPEDYFSDENLYGDPVGETFTCVSNSTKLPTRSVREGLRDLGKRA